MAVLKADEFCEISYNTIDRSNGGAIRELLSSTKLAEHDVSGVTHSDVSDVTNDSEVICG